MQNQVPKSFSRLPGNTKEASVGYFDFIRICAHTVSPPENPLGSQENLLPASEGAEEGEERSVEDDGELNEEEVAKCLHNLGPSATGLEYMYRSLSAPGRNLTDISILCSYIHLQKLELPYNKIKDLSCVSHMPYLLILDVSHNEISDFFGFHPPKNLKEVNFSYNQVSEMKVLSAYFSLEKLNVDHNSIREIRGLEKCARLRYLSLAHNRISRITGLGNLPLKELCLRGNFLRKVENMDTIWTLQTLDLSSNKIQSLAGLQNLQLLGSLNLEGNMVSEIKEATHIHDMPLLSELNLLRNPVQEQADYRLALIFLLQQLRTLDQQEVSAVNKYDPPPEVTAARDHMMHLVHQLRQPQVIFDSTLPSLDAPYPMLVLTGPQACGKRELAHRLCRDFNDFFAYGTCHTTRSPYFGEEDGSDYHFVSEEVFQDMILEGKFIQTMRYGEHWYGLSREAIESVAREGLACCVHMELEGVRSLKLTYFEPRYILLLPMDREGYGQRLRRRGLYSQAQINFALSRVDEYVKVNKEKPGFFDNFIPCDSTMEAYKALGQVVREYLGLEEQEETDCSSAVPENTSVGDSLTDGRSKGTQPAQGADQTDPTEDLRGSGLPTEKAGAALGGIEREKSWSLHYTQPLNRVSLTAPGSIGQQTLRDCASSSSVVPATGDGPPDLNEENSLQETPARSGRSSPQGMGVGLNMDALDIPGQVHNSDRLIGTQDPDHAPQTPQPSSPGGMTESASARPGSNAKPILPPIPSGRKATTRPK
ncbi:hypothetical protein AGOR_G00245410 [Albula goreensis]|uniref:Guanylate kinase-like domain-containing protein n=1 Tax=Albula goreensis TaxID=1534307 RepID=A0A8T3CAH8_9TELE|nr:hypothetical protein AGOR_G00245410 [Albula goreensis]